MAVRRSPSRRRPLRPRGGRVLGSEIIEDPDAVAECIRVRDLLWAVAVPHAEYKP
ncbi:DUF6879 family protein [Streptomyces sp. NPDC001508]|uniref:DUF6879 family protein n=1 Tax=Streptomyces sp. NPDC001508 TaxID=3154656 RepID=UPI00331F65E7